MKVRHFLVPNYNVNRYRGELSRYDGRPIETGFDLRAHMAIVNLEKNSLRRELHIDNTLEDRESVVGQMLQEILGEDIGKGPVYDEIADYWRRVYGWMPSL